MYEMFIKFVQGSKVEPLAKISSLSYVILRVKIMNSNWGKMRTSSPKTGHLNFNMNEKWKQYKGQRTEVQKKNCTFQRSHRK